MNRHMRFSIGIRANSLETAQFGAPLAPVPDRARSEARAAVSWRIQAMCDTSVDDIGKPTTLRTHDGKTPHANNFDFIGPAFDRRRIGEESEPAGRRRRR